MPKFPKSGFKSYCPVEPEKWYVVYVEPHDNIRLQITTGAPLNNEIIASNFESYLEARQWVESNYFVDAQLNLTHPLRHGQFIRIKYHVS